MLGEEDLCKQIDKELSLPTELKDAEDNITKIKTKIKNFDWYKTMSFSNKNIDINFLKCITSNMLKIYELKDYYDMGNCRKIKNFLYFIHIVVKKHAPSYWLIFLKENCIHLSLNIYLKKSYFKFLRKFEFLVFEENIPTALQNKEINKITYLIEILNKPLLLSSYKAVNQALIGKTRIVKDEDIASAVDSFIKIKIRGGELYFVELYRNSGQTIVDLNVYINSNSVKLSQISNRKLSGCKTAKGILLVIILHELQHYIFRTIDS